MGKITLQRYTTNVKAFEELTGIATQEPPIAATKIAAVDAAMSRCLEDMFFDGDPVSNGRYMYYAIRWQYCLKDAELPLSHTALQGFIKVDRETVRDPAPWEVAVIAARQLLQHDRSLAAVEAAALILLQFDLYSRPSELLFAS